LINRQDINFVEKLLKLIKNKKLAIIIVSCLLVFFIFLFIFAYQLQTPLSKNRGERIFLIEEGQGLEEISKNLRREGLVSNNWAFFYYIWLRGKTKNLQAGKYSLSPSMTVSEIAKKVINGEVIRDWIKVTILEGWRTEQIEQRLSKLGVISSEGKLPKDQEGFLFPDTYYFNKGSSPDEVVKRMQDNFDNKVTEDLRAEIERQGKILYDILIMASLIEKEVISDEDRAIVSGIFWKRLENNYPLESCATIAYILGVDKWRYSIEDTRIESPYNTYTNIGLPPTPINNPGLSTIKAAIYPKESDYNFFLTDPETGATVFSKTFEEHNANKRKYFE
jgi:UPF0755 protein